MKSIHSKEYQRALEALIAARKERQVLQSDLANKLGRPQSFVSKFEGRERRLDVVEFVAVCRAMGVNPVSLLLEAGLISEDDLGALGQPVER